MRRCLQVIALMGLVLSGARAEKIHLADGREFDGKAIVNGSTYTVNVGEKWYQFGKYDIQEIDGKPVNVIISIETDKGNMTVVLFEDDAPNTVANMVTLAEQGFYKGLAFHRIIPKFMAQGGCPNSKEGATGIPGTGGPGYKIADETNSGMKHTGRGILSMANSGPNTNGSQFFICFKETPHLDGKHTVFGKVVDGFAVLDMLEAIGTPEGKPKETVRFDIKVVAKRDHAYEVKKLD